MKALHTAMLTTDRPCTPQRVGAHASRRMPLRWQLLLVLLPTSVLGSPEACQQTRNPFQLPENENTLKIQADFQEKDKQSYLARGHVEVSYQHMKLTADEATFDEDSQELVARGHVTFTDPQSYLEGDEAHYNVETQNGIFWGVHGYFHTALRPRPRLLTTENPFYFRAQSVERLDPTTYLVQRGRMSPCDPAHAGRGWSMSVRRARVHVDKKFIATDPVFRLMHVPVFIAPAAIGSLARAPRETGFLLPHVGNSSQKGFILGAGFFWAINPSADLLIGAENYSVRGLGRLGRFRARPSETSEITVDYFGVNDKGGGPLRQSRAPGQTVHALGEASDLGHGFRGVLDVDYVTSLAFRLTFTDNFTQAVNSESRQTGFLTKGFGSYSFNFYASRYQNFLSTSRGPGNQVSIWQTPSFSFAGIDQPLGGSPLYFSFEASAAGVGRLEPDFSTPSVSDRLDFHPQITLRTKPFWGFHFTPAAGLRTTRYGTSLKADRGSLGRVLGELSADLRPPSFEKVFAHPVWGRRFKHVVEPDIRYRLVRARDARDLTDVVRFDQTDILAETSEFEYSLTNSLLVRKEAPEGAAETPQARELLSLRLSQKYYFDPTFGGVLVPGQKVVFDPTISLTGFAFARGQRLSPVVSVLKFSPSSNYDTELRADSNPNGGGVLNAGITSHVRRGPLGLAFTDFFINRTATLLTPRVPASSLATLRSFNLFRTVATYGDVNRKGFSGAFGIDYNLAQGIAHQVVSQVSYNFGCFGLDFEYRRFALGTLRRENLLRIAISLANVGTIGNLKPRERLY